MSANLKSLIGRLNDTCRNALEGAAGLCLSRTNYDVDVEHLLVKLGETPDTDFHRILRRFEIDESRLAKDLVRSLDRLKTGNTRTPALSPRLPKLVEEAWLLGSIDFGASRVRSSHILLALLEKEEFARLAREISKEFAAISVETLRKSFVDIVTGSVEDRDASSLGEAPAGDTAGGATGVPGRTKALDQYTVDLTARAKAGHIDPILGRDFEIRQVIDILTRRRQNNPILTGEAGVGKTAVVEGFAQRLARCDVPPQLQGVSLLSLDLGLLQAGASMKGEFEQRLRQLIDEVQASPKPIILFIDEVHTLVGAGGAAGTGDAANLLKPALARGTLRTIGATTWAEYKKYIEKDPALTRRFQVVQVPEPDELKAILMLRGVASVLEKHHRVQLLDEAIESAVKLSHRYIPARQLPDKAVSLLDTACARVAVSQHAIPAEVEDSRRRIESMEIERAIIDRESAVGVNVGTRRSDVDDKLGSERDRLAGLEKRWQDEKAIVDRVLALRAQLRGDDKPVDKPAASESSDVARPASSPAEAAPAIDRPKLLDELHAEQQKLETLQGDSPLIMPSVDAQAVASVVADWTGIPVGRMVKNELQAILKLGEALGRRVIGQQHGLDMIAKRIQTSRARLDNPNKPIGVFMLVGPSGVGKTETAIALAETLYGGEQNMITINMSEFQEAHTVSSLKGAPPGYVGYGEGGRLTEAVRRKPYSVVLLDEVEKAHPDVHELFFQVFDKGRMEDGEGRMIDFKNTIILLTSNAGSELVMNMCKDPELLPDPESLATAMTEPLQKIFPPALLGRLVVIPYYPLSNEMLGQIVRLQLDRIKKRVAENHKIPFEYSDDAVKLIVRRCNNAESGGRIIDSILTNTVLPTVSIEYLTRTSEGGELKAVRLGVAEDDFTYAFE